jgi:hypothetical protein
MPCTGLSHRESRRAELQKINSGQCEADHTSLEPGAIWEWLRLRSGSGRDMTHLGEPTQDQEGGSKTMTKSIWGVSVFSISLGLAVPLSTIPASASESFGLMSSCDFVNPDRLQCNFPAATERRKSNRSRCNAVLPSVRLQCRVFTSDRNLSGVSRFCKIGTPSPRIRSCR